MDEIFRALADPSRRALLDRLNDHNGQTLRELCADLTMTRQAVSKHLAVLIEAELVTTVRRGREKLHFLNAAPINAVADRWIRHYDRGRAQALADLKTALERPTMSDSDFVYVTYIRTTPERLWQALTDPAFTQRYWGASLISEWTPGAPFVYEERGVQVTDPEQVVLEAEPPRRLAYTWHTFTDEIAAQIDYSGDRLARVRAEPRSRVSFDLEPQDGQVRLTVVHSGFGPDSTLQTDVSQGWPGIISSLKTLLETGSPLAAC